MPAEFRNLVLSALSQSDLERIVPKLEFVPLKLRQKLEMRNQFVRYAYFPESGIVSVVASAVGGGRQAEVGLIGYEGMTGLPVVLATDCSPHDVFVQAEGAAHRLRADALRKMMRESTSASVILLRYAHVFAVQTSYSALANAQGKIEERLARWLLMAQDRLQTTEITLTHEFLALMLGVRRAGVTSALSDLVNLGLVSLARGRITILNLQGLGDITAGLYGAPEAEFRRLFPQSRNPGVVPVEAQIIGKLMRDAMELHRADFADVQLLTNDNTLVLSQHSGVNEPFISAFRVVTADHASTCARALRLRRSVMVRDVREDADYAPLVNVADAAGFRAVQSTPVIASNGQLIGVVSTLFVRPHSPSSKQMATLARTAREAADAIIASRSYAAGAAPVSALSDTVRKRPNIS